MRLAFRVDASLPIGSGRVMRCLTLADELKRAGNESHFICRAGPGDLLDHIAEQGHATHALGDGKEAAAWDIGSDAQATRALVRSIRPDWLVVDHYRIDVLWETALRPHCRKILVIDDLADRPHDCDALVDQNVYVDGCDRYLGLVPLHCARLIGPEFALLRQEFVQARSALRPRRFVPPFRLHVFFGGSDPTRETLRTLTCLPPHVARRFSIDVVVGSQNPDRERIESTAAELRDATVAVQVTNIARHVAEADVAVGACGSAALERCSLGLPTLTLITAPNQRELAAGLARRGAIFLLGPSASVGDDELAAAIAGCLEDPDELRRVADAGMALFPGDIDGARRLAELMRAS